MALGIVAAGASRYLICAYSSMDPVQALTYNAIDMVVSAVSGKIFASNPSPRTFPIAILASRILGCLAGAAITTAIFGPVDILLVIALNVTSFAVGFIIDLVTRWMSEDSPLLFVYV